MSLGNWYTEKLSFKKVFKWMVHRKKLCLRKSHYHQQDPLNEMIRLKSPTHASFSTHCGKRKVTSSYELGKSCISALLLKSTT